MPPVKRDKQSIKWLHWCQLATLQLNSIKLTAYYSYIQFKVTGYLMMFLNQSYTCIRTVFLIQMTSSNTFLKFGCIFSGSIVAAVLPL